MREYGGYLPLELPPVGEEYFSGIRETDIWRLNCCRSAFYCAAKELRLKKVYVPYLNCQRSIDPFRKAGIQCEFYYLNEDLTPKGITPGDKEGVLWINYYGNATEQQKKKVLGSYHNLILDHCHAFFSQPVMREDICNCYSVRKFFGVADGAYLIKGGLSKIDLEQDFSHKRAGFLLKAMEEGTNAAYPDSLKNEEELADRVKSMSSFTRRVLSSIDYGRVQKIRRRNFLRLHGRLGHLNEFSVNIESDTHVFYPFLITRDYLREKLIQSRVYIPTLWRHVPSLCVWGGGG